jgi:hypothetical protein
MISTIQNKPLTCAFWQETSTLTTNQGLNNYVELHN